MMLLEGSLMAIRDLGFSRRTGRQSGPATMAGCAARRTTAHAAEITADAAFERALGLAGLEGRKP
jgi:hypothetical protein